jgi:trehalose-6-phosphate synthase
MHWTKAVGEGRELQVVIYRNGTAAGIGGAKKVIESLPMKVWLSPQQVDAEHPAVPDSEWKQDEKHEVVELNAKELGGKKPYRAFTFPVSESLYKAQYKKIANELIWPIFHSMDADALIDPLSVISPHHRQNYDFPYQGSPDDDYGLYRQFNECGAKAYKQLRQRGIVKDEDLVWVHDYQCVNMPGDIYTHHTPFPPLDFLRKVTINRKPLLEYGFFREYIKDMLGHGLLTFQRPIDMKNFIEVVAALDKQCSAVGAPQSGLAPTGLLDLEGKVTRNFAIEEHAQLTAFGKTARVMNLPVPIDRADELRLARESKVDQSSYAVDDLERMNISYDEQAVYTATNKKGDPVRKVNIQHVTPLHRILNEDGHRIFLAAHRADYTKCALEKLYAAGNYLGSLTERDREKVHFVFFLQPTRPGVEGFPRYQKEVEETAKGLRRTYGDSIIVIPDAIAAQDYIGLMRHKNVVALLGVGLKDGHDLTLREAASARSDFIDEQRPADERAALAIVTTDGTGASDILSDPKKSDHGAFVLRDIENPRDMVIKLHKLFQEIDGLAKTPEGRQHLTRRYQEAAEASAIYGPEYFREAILKVAEKNRSQGAA